MPNDAALLTGVSMESQLGTLYQYQAERDDHDDDACDKHGSCKCWPNR